jgi:uncharacterized protein YjbI with pentapeptide repeats
LRLRSPVVLATIGVVATLFLALAVVVILLLTDDPKAVSDNAAVIGALVALGGVFTAQIVSIELDDRRTHEARELEAQRSHETALQNYLEQVGKLLIEKPVRKATPRDDLSTVVRAQTLAVLEGLDPDRKRILLQFLYESRLLDRANLVVSLDGANLGKANLREANLREVNLDKGSLKEVNLREASLREAHLIEADLSYADLRGADLSYADLRVADLSYARLDNANLEKADLGGARLGGARLQEANLQRANVGTGDLTEYSDEGWLVARSTFVADLTKADLRGADLGEALLAQARLIAANLADANLSKANLANAKLANAELRGANLSNTNLMRSDLAGASVSKEQLEEAKSLEGTTMPDGSKRPMKRRKGS